MESSRTFINELGNQIKITIEGPTSISENTLTPVEAANLSEAMSEAVPLAWRYRHSDWDAGSPWALSNEYPREHAGMGGRIIEPLGPFGLAAPMSRLRSTAAMLYQNCVACVRDHHGHEGNLPGWLADAQKDIETTPHHSSEAAMREALEAVDAEFVLTGHVKELVDTALRPTPSSPEPREKL